MISTGDETCRYWQPSRARRVRPNRWKSLSSRSPATTRSSFESLPPACATLISRCVTRAFPVPQPIVLGHEGAGVVEKVGCGVAKVRVGDHVVMTYNSCGLCESCYEREPTYCHDFFGRNFAGGRADGTSPLSKGKESIHGNFFGQSSFANYALCNERNVVKVPKDVPLERLGPAGLRDSDRCRRRD